MELLFWNSESIVEVRSFDDEVIALTLIELVEDDEKSTHDNTHYKKDDSVEIYLGIDEVKEVIRALQSMLPSDAS